MSTQVSAPPGHTAPPEWTPAEGWMPTQPGTWAQPRWLQRVGQVGRRFGRQQVPVVFAVLQQHPRLFWSWLGFAAQMMPYGQLPQRWRELLILRTAWNSRCRYEWGQHVQIAQQVGLSAQHIGWAAGRGAPEATQVEHALLQACDELCGLASLSQHSKDTLQSHLNAAQLLELQMLVGHYRMLAGVINSHRLALDADMERHLQAFYRRVS